MSKLFDSVSRKPRPRVRVSMLLIFIAILFTLLNTPERTRGVPARAPAQQACSTDFTLSSSVVTDSLSIDCFMAKTKAYNKAKQAVETQRNEYVCPQACPKKTEVTPNHITSDPECEPVEVSPGVIRYRGKASAATTLKCDPL